MNEVPGISLWKKIKFKSDFLRLYSLEKEHKIEKKTNLKGKS